MTNEETRPLLAGVLLVAAPDPVTAQDCGANCDPYFQCGHAWVMPSILGCTACHNEWKPVCAFSKCKSCFPEPELVSDQPSVEEITGALESVKLEEVSALVSMYGPRLRVHAGRSMATVLGGCTGESLSVMVYLEPAIVEAW